MCGLAAVFLFDAKHSGGLRAPDPLVEAMCTRMQARGPDGAGQWSDPEAGVGLGHRRLAIIDLDNRAAQPMHSSCGRFVIVYNGEIYNFAQLRDERLAAGDTMHTSSDTEVLLAMYAAEGEAMLRKLRGMFAFVIWDRVAKRAFAARDPYGIKPLYYATSPQGILFASQVKALLAAGIVSREPDLTGQAGFWLLGSVPEPRTWYKSIRCLPAGHCVSLQDGGIGEPRSYWDIGQAWREGGDGAPPSDPEIRERVAVALRASVAHHLVSDVPVGVFLSGGIDSGALAGLMVEAGAQSLEGVTIAYDEYAGSPRDEAPVAARIAAHYGIRHHVRRVTRQEFLNDLPRILRAMDQPSIDGINTWYASKAVAERGLKVVVSGVGGDELFQGYASFRELPRLVAGWSALSRLPGARYSARRLGEILAGRSGNSRWRHAVDWAASLPAAWWLRRSIRGPEELAELMGAEQAATALRGFDADAWTQRMSGALPSDARLALGQIESTTYLRNQLLRDSDWASMDHSVELRTPLVDAWLLNEVRDLLPYFHRFPGKRLLAHAPARSLPDAVIERPKTGFGIPLERWLPSPSGGRSVSRTWASEVAAAMGDGT